MTDFLGKVGEHAGDASFVSRRIGEFYEEIGLVQCPQHFHPVTDLHRWRATLDLGHGGEASLGLGGEIGLGPAALAPGGGHALAQAVECIGRCEGQFFDEKLSFIHCYSNDKTS